MQEVFLLKAAALVHDPPNKAFLMVTGQRHEDAARAIFSRLFGHERADLLKSDYIREADALSASSDRQFLLHAMGGRWIEGFKPFFKIIFKGQINPLFESRELEDMSGFAIKEEGFADFDFILDALEKELEKVPDERKYFFFYLLWEQEWVTRGLVGPADTRVPTFTALDHGYATATALNFVLFESRLALLDIAGVQKFISHSRKLRDAWVSSYLVSALLWYTVVEHVMELGPDTVIMPSLRLNPFFAHSLSRRFPSCSDLIEPIIWGSPIVQERVIPQALRRLGMPPYPVLPGKALIVVPRGSRTDFRERFEEGWKLLVKGARMLARRRAASSPLWRFIDLAFDYIEERMPGVLERPPLKLRYIEGERVVRSPRDYAEAVRELWNRAVKEKAIRVEPEAEVDLEEATSSAFSGESIGFPVASRRGFDYCTSCAKMPAAIIMPVEEDYSAVLATEIGEVPDGMMFFFSPGERLCPWCFLKRVISIEPRLLRILMDPVPESGLESFIDEIAEQEFGRLFPSTVHIALAEGIARLPRRDIEVPEEAKLWMWGLAERLARENPLALKVMEVLDEEVYRGAGPDIDDRFLWRYYALLRGDADSMGMLLSGNTLALWNPETNCRAEELSLEGAKLIIVSSAEGDVKKILREKLEKGEFGDLVFQQEDHCSGEGMCGRPFHLTPSISYHTVISASLMKAALLDIKVINELNGFVVYAGGDDLLALLPVNRALEAVRETRRNFSKKIDLESYPVVPMLHGVGRSYSLLVVHYRYPLSAALEQSSISLDLAKERVVFNRGQSFRKDLLVLERVPGGERAFIPLAPYRSIEEDQNGSLHPNVEDYERFLASIPDSLQAVLQGMRPLSDTPKLSSNILHDAALLYRDLDTLASLGESELMRKMLERLLERNMAPGLREKMKLADLGQWVMDDLLLTSRISVKEGGRERPLVVEFFEALKVVGGGMR